MNTISNFLEYLPVRELGVQFSIRLLGVSHFEFNKIILREKDVRGLLRDILSSIRTGARRVPFDEPVQIAVCLPLLSKLPLHYEFCDAYVVDDLAPMRHTRFSVMVIVHEDRSPWWTREETAVPTAL